MRIYYDLASKEWLSPSGATMGSSLLPLKSCTTEAEKHSARFSLSSRDNNAGPVIGILTGKGKDDSLAGNGPLFKALQKEIMQNEGISFVFTAENMGENSIIGYIYLPETDKWIQAVCPLPHLVYNRIPFRKQERTDSFKKACHFFQEHEIPFFNPAFLDKYEVYQLLKQHPVLHKHLPDTILVTGELELGNFLEKYQRIYLKPLQGSKGKGIYRLSHSSGRCIVLSGIKHSFTFKDYKSFWNAWEHTFTAKSYLAQEAINPAKLDGRRFDFRILTHYSKDGYQVTGVGIRQSKDQEITTHIPNGGVLIPYEKVKTKEHEEFIRMAVAESGKLLIAEKGFYGEFSMDAGLTDQGNYVIYELNSKPMSFDENPIEMNRIKELTRLFFELTGY